MRRTWGTIAWTMLFLLASTACRAEKPSEDPLPRGAFARLGTPRFRADREIETVQLSPDGKRVAVAQHEDDMLLFDAATGQRLLRFESSGVEAASFVSFSTFSRDGALFAANRGRWLTLHDASTGKALAMLARPETRRAVGLWFSGDSRWLFCTEGDRETFSSNTFVTIIDVAKRRQVREIALGLQELAMASIAPDGKKLAIRFLDRESREQAENGVRLWDLERGKPLDVLPETFAVNDIVFGPDSKTLATVQDDSIITLWDLATGKPRWRQVGRHMERFGLFNSGSWCTFSPDGKQLALAATSKSPIQVYSVADGQLLALHSPEKWIKSLTFTPEGSLVVAESTWSTVRVRVWRPGEPTAADMDGHDETVRQLAFDGQGERLYSADINNCFAWNLRTGDVRRCDEAERLTALSPSGRTERFVWSPWVEAGAPNGKATLSVWDVKTERELWLRRCEDSRPHCTALSPDGRIVALSSRLPVKDSMKEVLQLHVWDVKADKELWHVETPQAWLDQLQFSPDGKLLLARAGETGWEVWDVARRSRLRALATENDERADSFLFAQDSRSLYAAVRLPDGKGRIRRWDAGTGKPVAPLALGDTGRPPTALALSSDGKTLAAGYGDGTILLWDLAGRNRADLAVPPLKFPLPTSSQRLALTTPPVDSERLPAGACQRLGTSQFRIGRPIGEDSHAAVLSPNGKVLAAAEYGREIVHLLDPESGREIGSFRSKAYPLAFSPDSALLLAGTSNDTDLCDLRNASVRRTGERCPWRGGMNFTADSRYYTAFNKDKLQIWDAQTGKVTQSIDIPFNPAGGAALSGDGSAVVCWPDTQSGGDKHGVIVFDLNKKQLLRKLIPEGEVLAAAWSPDGQCLALAEQLVDNGSRPALVFCCLSVWEVATGKLLYRTRLNHQTKIAHEAYRLGYSPDGKRLGFACESGHVELRDATDGRFLSQRDFPDTKVWSLTFLPGGAVRAACSRGQLVYAADVDTGRVPDALAGPQAAADKLLFSRDGKTLSAFSELTRRDWTVATGKQVAAEYDFSPRDERKEYNPDPSGLEIQEIRCQAISGNRRLSAVLSIGSRRDDRPARLCLRDTRTDRVLYLGYEGKARITAALALSGSGRTMAVARTNALDEYNENLECEVVVRDTATRKEKASLVLRQRCETLLFSPDETLLAVHAEVAVEVFYADSGIHSLTLGLPEKNDELLLVFAPDGRTLATGLYDADQNAYRVRVWEMATGHIRREFTVRSAVTALAFSPDGRLLASAHADTTILLWDILGGVSTTKKATPEQLRQWWTDLANSDAAKGLLAMQELVARPGQTTEWLAQKLSPVQSAVTEADLKQLIADLDHDDFKRREQASRRLRSAGARMVPLVRGALAMKPSPEQKRRLEELVEALKTCPPDPELVRPTRALEVLERIGTPEAKELLETLAKGAAEAPLTQDAKATLKRLAELPEGEK
jgi:WD40 repeat protein